MSVSPGAASPDSGSPVVAKPTRPTRTEAPPSTKTSAVPKLALAGREEKENKSKVLTRSLSQMLPSNLVPHSPHAALTARTGPTRALQTFSARGDPGSAAATVSIRVFITSDLTPHRTCALIVKQGWVMEDFIAAAALKLSGGPSTPRAANSSSGAPAAAVFASNGAEISVLDDLREDDQILLRFQKRLSVLGLSPQALASLAPPAPTFSASHSSESIPSLRDGDDPQELMNSLAVSYVPMDGVFRLLLPDLSDVSPLSLSEDLVADLVQDELKQLQAINAADPTVPTGATSLRILLKSLLLASETDSLLETILYTYDYLLPHHTLFSILVVHFRAPLVPMEVAQATTAANVVRPLPPARLGAASTLPTYGMSVHITDPIKRNAAQTRIVNIIKKWISLRFKTLKEDLAVIELLDEFVVYLMASPDRLKAYGEQIAQTLKTARKHYLNAAHHMEISQPHQLPREQCGYSKAVEASPFELASQLTIADQQIFQRLKLYELQALQFDHPDRNLLAPRVVEWVNHSTFVTSFVVASILGPLGEANPGPRRRAQIIGHFLSAMEELRYMKSYNAMMQIYHALKHPAIERLEATWDAVSPKHIAIRDAVAELVKQPNSSGYHSLIQAAESPALPYVEYHLNELRHIEEEDTILDNGDINLVKLERLSKALHSIVRLQINTYQLVPNSGFMSFLRNYEIPSVGTLIELSNALESDQVTAEGVRPDGAPGRIVVRGPPRTGSDSARSNSNSPTNTGVDTSAIDQPKIKESRSFGGLLASVNAAISDHGISMAALSSVISQVKSDSGAGSSAPDAASPGAAGSKKLAPKVAAERRRKESASIKLAKAQDKEEEKKRKKYEKQSKKIRPLLTAALSLEQGLLNDDIFEQFMSYSLDAPFQNAVQFYKTVLEFKKLFGSDAETASRRGREEASRISLAYLHSNSTTSIEFPSSLDTQIKEIDTRSRSETNLFTNSLFDPLTVDIGKMLNTAWVVWKAQRTSAMV